MTFDKQRIFKLVLLIPSAQRKVAGELDKATLELSEKVRLLLSSYPLITNPPFPFPKKLAPKHPHLPPITSLPAIGLTASEVSAVLTQLSELPNTKWENGRVSGAVYHGGEEMNSLWIEAFTKFVVSNPLHADVFPGVRKMDSEIVAMCLSLFNSPLPSSILDSAGGAGTTTSGGTESILMACKSYRDRALAEYGITEPEMIVPISAHAAFDKAAKYFKIKIHFIPVDVESRKVNLKLVKRAINPNTIMLVGSAPNFPDGIIDGIVLLPCFLLLSSKTDLVSLSILIRHHRII